MEGATFSSDDSSTSRTGTTSTVITYTKITDDGSSNSTDKNHVSSNFLTSVATRSSGLEEIAVERDTSCFNNKTNNSYSSQISFIKDSTTSSCLSTQRLSFPTTSTNTCTVKKQRRSSKKERSRFLLKNLATIKFIVDKNRNCYNYQTKDKHTCSGCSTNSPPCERSNYPFVQEKGCSHHFFIDGVSCSESSSELLPPLPPPNFSCLLKREAQLRCDSLSAVTTLHC